MRIEDIALAARNAHDEVHSQHAGQKYRCLDRAPIFCLALNAMGIETRPAMGTLAYFREDCAAVCGDPADLEVMGLGDFDFVDNRHTDSVIHCWVHRSRVESYDNSLPVDLDLDEHVLIMGEDNHSYVEGVRNVGCLFHVVEIATAISCGHNEAVAKALGLPVSKVEAAGEALAIRLLREGTSVELLAVVNAYFGGTLASALTTYPDTKRLVRMAREGCDPAMNPALVTAFAKNAHRVREGAV